MTNKRRALIATALATACVANIGAAQAADDGKDAEQCYGVVKAGQNNCATSTHSCAGKAKKDNDPNEWKLVAKGTCTQMGGKLSAPSK